MVIRPMGLCRFLLLNLNSALASWVREIDTFLGDVTGEGIPAGPAASPSQSRKVQSVAVGTLTDEVGFSVEMPTPLLRVVKKGGIDVRRSCNCLCLGGNWNNDEKERTPRETSGHPSHLLALLTLSLSGFSLYEAVGDLPYHYASLKLNLNRFI